MHPRGVGVVEGVRQADLVEQPQHLQQHRPLPPRPGLRDLDVAVARRHGLLHRGPPRGQVVSGEETVVAAARRVHPGPVPAEGVHRVGHEPLVPGPPRGLELCVAVPARSLGLRDDALVGPPQTGQAQPRPRRGALSVRQVGPGRGRPLLGEHWRHRGDGRADPRQHRRSREGVVDGRLDHVAQRPRAPPLQHQHPGPERAGHHRRERPRAGYGVQAQVGEGLQGRGRRRRALSAHDVGALVVLAPHQRGQVAPGPVEVGLDHLQDEAGGHRRVDGVAAPLEHPHPGLAGEPVGAGHHAEGTCELGSGRHGGSLPAAVATDLPTPVSRSAAASVGGTGRLQAASGR